MFLSSVARTRLVSAVCGTSRRTHGFNFNYNLSRSFSAVNVTEGAEILNDLSVSGKVDTVIVGYTDLYGRLLGKRYDADCFANECLKNGTHACTYTFAVDMPMNPLEGFDFASWDKGFGDLHLVPDTNSLRRAAWLDRTLLILCDVYDSTTHDLIPIAPRSLLRNMLSQVEEVIGGGCKVKSASELEYYLYNTSFREANEKGYRYSELEPAGWYSEDYHILQASRTEPFHQKVRNMLKASGLPVENSKGETGIGQHELNVAYNDVLLMADRHVTFKQCMKEVADQMGMSITFMAKPTHEDAGSSCHIHLSIQDKYGKNLFQGDETLGTVKGCSKLFINFLGGWIKHTPELYCLYAPTINSYKRFQAGSWAPTACAWGDDNRTTGFRIVGSGPSLRIECRLPGADVNPYLAFAAGLASGLDGVKKGIDPPPMFSGNAYAADDAAVNLPTSLGEAAEMFGKSEFVRETFGEKVQQHYHRFYMLEQQAYDAVVTDWERQRYFEQI
mmetsp:Transcript_506/g.677  ORF Transcript_506/g.677 Transcript_506/m.677 type:complete len:502 (+) Transcript_506:115-1620(+)|eukprot:CAMPEP_0204837180 /NCGR_PEP_ID=MMETSP1346-20131115/27277_1 /ASSEMBLY_ACC=CAM_ASM_000771 /TAXON_ID=215587 /ORGANISM="Aplanochytrium stocchinoi, Strain GSBS06" /LENGTH=501 /DNA_ID=CAMNT_0051972473 /DNA_START=71 /DNA_END=1576 /DNA_ORIENTATION=+